MRCEKEKGNGKTYCGNGAFFLLSFLVYHHKFSGAITSNDVCGSITKRSLPNSGTKSINYQVKKANDVVDNECSDEYVRLLQMMQDLM